MFNASSSEEPISVVFNPALKVAGEVLEGEVHLNFPALIKDKIEEVHVKLRGAVFTRITRQIGQSTQQRRQKIQLVKQEVSVWAQGNSTYPPPGSHILKLPFQFTLPDKLLPSCEFGGFHRKATVGYFIQVVGKRPGLRLNERLPIPFPIIPSLQSGAQLRDSLKQGWQGPWKVIDEEKYIRRGIWGERSHVKMNIVMPDIDAFPVLTPIPFTFTVITHSKPLKRDDCSSNEPIFPTPPLTPKDVDFRIERDVNIRAQSWTTTSTDNFVAYLGGLGPGLPLSAYEQVRVEAMEKVWIPSDGDEKKQKGSWKQEVTYRSSFRLSCPPTFDGDTMRVHYTICMKVDFPGIGNSLKAEFPVKVVSCMYPPGQRAWDGPPPEIELPPDYFQATTWNQDEKD